MQISNQIYSHYQSFGGGKTARNTGASFANTMAGITSTKSNGENYTVFLPNKNTVYSGGQSNGLSYKIDYAENSTSENPIMIATGIDEVLTQEMQLLLSFVHWRRT